MFSVVCKLGVPFSDSEKNQYKSLVPNYKYFDQLSYTTPLGDLNVLIKKCDQSSGLVKEFDLAASKFILFGTPFIPELKKDFYSQVDGFFVGIEITEKSVRFIRDPIGSRAFYHSQISNKPVLATEIKSFKCIEGFDLVPRGEAIAEYLSFSFIPGEKTFIKDINEISLGSYLEYGIKSTKQVDYCRYHENEGQWDNLGIDELKGKFSQTLKESKEICDKSVGSESVYFLSGGLDSSAVLAMACQSGAAVPKETLSVHFGEDLPNENEYIDLMVDRYKTKHEYLEVTPKKFIGSIEEIFEHVDDPIGDPVVVPNFLMNQHISGKRNFVFTGEGGDPCLGGPKNKAMLMANFYGPGFGDDSRDYLELSYLNSFKRGFDDLHLSIPDISTDSINRMVEFLCPYLREERLKHFTNRIMLSNIKLKATSLIMPKVQKTTMAFGNMSVSPLYTRRFIEDSMKVPPNYKLMNGDEKYILKLCMSDIVPAEIINRPKSGMRVPLRIWSSAELLRFYKDYLYSNKTLVKQWINFDYVKRLISKKRGEDQPSRVGLKLWMIISFFHYLKNITNK
tara:strand:- start:554 stop:2248 length:1695 start_codon:yes stop_codon:yes gene_type:complete